MGTNRGIPTRRLPETAGVFRGPWAIVLLVLCVGGPVCGQTCNRMISADVVALDQPFFWNRLGASQPQGMVFALVEDVVSIDGGPASAGNARLRSGKRPRPMVLRMNVGDCLQINFQNLLSPSRIHLQQPATRTASVSAIGLQLVDGIASDGSNVGTNASSLVPPDGSHTYTFYAEHEGTHLLYSAAANTGGPGNGGSLTAGLFGAVNVEPAGAEWYRSQVTRDDIELARIGTTAGNHPIIDYDAIYPPAHAQAGRPMFHMLDGGNKIRHSDLTAIIAGPGRGSFPAGTYPPNPVYPNRDQSFREYTIIYHDEIEASQVFTDYQNPVFKHTLKSVRDAFAINYGTAGIGSEILSNRRNLGPMHDCTDCKYEEFFLSSWAVGDPAMIVDVPANANANPGPKATVALYPDDPSNVYHSYIGDHVKFRVLHGGPADIHLHHLHAHQWLYSPDSDNSAYLDSQALGPGAAFTMEIPYRGSGNRNQTVGDSIFHCHFYPHFAQGMWSLWRVHDVFEEGTLLDGNGRPAPGARALPDGEIPMGTPIPAVVPIPGLVMAPMPEADVDIVQMPGRPGGQVQITGTGNPGFPFFIAGVAGHRAPHPPLDTVDDGGLPRHVVTGGTTMHIETRLDFTKDLLTLQAVELPESGTAVEQAAMTYHAQRLHPSFTTDGVAGDYVVNGLAAVAGAPYADPCIDDLGNSVGTLRTYKAADIQMDLVLNKIGWHFPQTRLTALWDDVTSTLDGTKAPEPLFMRANTNDCIEYHLTNLVPNYYEMDDFQVRTPTDVLGQHIHLVKFDVTSSDGSANGYNYEDGSFSPGEVRERIGAIRAFNGCVAGDPRDGTFECPVARPHPFFGSGPSGAWIGAQTTVQRWYADDVLNNMGEDRTLRTVFTHDHFGPSTHQQAGLYAGLVVEPAGSTWRHSETGEIMGTRGDGGPTSFRADILTTDPAHSFREFLLEFADYQLAYQAGGSGFPDPANAINATAKAPDFLCPNGLPAPCPEAVSNSGKATLSLNYRNEPSGTILPGAADVLGGRLIDPMTQDYTTGVSGDAAHLFRSIARANPAFNVQPSVYPPLTADVQNTDPFTPLLRAYENDPVQIRTLVGAHGNLHQFSIQGVKWLLEPSDPNSGFRNSQPMGISEHFEFLFTVPPSDGLAPSADYLYLAGAATGDLTGGGIWGLLRAYDGDVALRNDLLTLPNNPEGRAPLVNTADFVGVCPTSAPLRQYNVTAVTAEQSLSVGTLTYNARTTNGGPIHDPEAMLFFRSEDLDATLHPNPGVPIEPLILRANAGDCIEVTLFNEMDTTTAPFTGGQSASTEVALHPQLVAIDVATDNGINVGANAVQTVLPGSSHTYRWYAGQVVVNADGTRTAVPIEFGASNLMPADPIEQVAKGMIGGLIVEPLGSTWVADADSRASATVTKSDGSSFREFVLLFQDDIALQPQASFGPQKFTTAINYRTEPMWQRIGYDPNTTSLDQTGSMDLTSVLSNSQVQGDPVTPVFTAAVGEAVRFRVLHPGGNQDHVFQVHGHIWERAPYINASTEIGDNPLSEWEGARVGLGAAGHFDAVLKHGAGGAFGVPGDYLYRAFTSFEFDAGIWGLFRVACSTNADCDDGLFCNGQETCFVGTCLGGIPIDCNDGVVCTIDACNDATDSCDHTPDDTVCDDGLVCNGIETCDPVLDCLGGDPCPGLSTADLNSGLTPTNLVNSLAGFVGATVPDISNVTYAGANAAAGTFTGGSGIIGFFQNGVMLSTGVIADVIGPNTADNTTTDHGTPGDADLDLVTGGMTSDAAALEFDFICPGNTPGAGSTIVFDYVLASEAYNELVGSPPTEALGFFLNGTNIAVLQDGITPVSTETVNCGSPYAPPGGGPECDQFVNNDCNDIPPGTFPCEGNRATEMDGMTTVLTAQGALLPGVNQINHLKLVIADTALGVPDSAVFILAGSLECRNLNFPPVPRSLKAIPAPEPVNLLDFVKDKDAAIVLGKSLFWDMQTGGDGMQACATCHFNAGADARIRNTLHPGANGLFNVGGPNYTLQSTDFPFASSPSPLDADDIVGSQGVVRRDFTAVVPGGVEDDGVPIPDPVHNVGGINTRRVTARNTPSVINAVYDVRSFWDGRANFVFNGVNPFGLRDPNNPTVLEVQLDGSLLPASVVIEKASLASQAVGPPNNDTEMSWNGRTFPELGRKLLSLQPLARQAVDPTDGVLGGMADPSGRGLATTYETMIQNAFWEKYWDSNVLTPDGFTVMEANFSLFFGLAVQVYEATLVSDDSPFDRFRDGDPNALTQQQKDGLDVFMGPGLCVLCHKGAEFTGASQSAQLLLGRFETELLEPMVMGDGTAAVYDTGFYNIGVRPTSDDLGAGGTDPFGNPLSFTRLSQQGVNIGPPFNFPAPVDPLQRVAVDGSFKVPSLRNVELTGPYMHNGGMETLEQVVEFYTRGGDFPDVNIADLAPLIQTLPLTALDRANLVAFLQSLTDERVRSQEAPFDHPQLFIPHGHVGDDVAVVDDGNGAGVDCLVELPAVGANGTTPAPLSASCLVLCGNGVIDLAEDCDDGNTVNGDCCSSTCQFEAFDAPCSSGIPCESSSCDGAGFCQAGATACADPCEQCNPSLNACAWCVFDHNFSGATDGLDFAFFSGCFGGCYSSADPCIAANYDQDVFGCVGGGDFGGFSGCFGLTCGQCANCWGPTGANSNAGNSGGEPASGIQAAIQLVAVTVPTAEDFSPTLPSSVERLDLNESFELEIWVTRGGSAVGSGDALASVYVDVHYDPKLLSVQNIVPGRWFETFGRGVIDTKGHVQAVGGCAPLGDGSIGTDGGWVRVATVRMRVGLRGTAAVTVAPAFRPFGVSLHGRLGDVPPSQIKFGGVTLNLGAARRPEGKAEYVRIPRGRG